MIIYFRFCILIALGLSFANPAISQDKKDKKKVKNNSLQSRLPIFVDLTVNGHPDSLQFAVMTELVARKFKVIDRRQLIKLQNDELIRMVRIPLDQSRWAEFRSSSNEYSNSGRTVAQQLTIELSIHDHGEGRQVDSLAWTITPVPPTINRPAIRTVVSSPSDLNDLLPILYDRIAPERKK